MFFLFFLIPCAFFSSNIASNKDYDRVNWFFAGLFFGPLGLLAISGMPDKKLRRYIQLLAKAQGVDSEDFYEYKRLPPIRLSLMPDDKNK